MSSCLYGTGCVIFKSIEILYLSTTVWAYSGSSIVRFCLWGSCYVVVVRFSVTLFYCFCAVSVEVTSMVSSYRTGVDTEELKSKVIDSLWIVYCWEVRSEKSILIDCFYSTLVYSEIGISRVIYVGSS